MKTHVRGFCIHPQQTRTLRLAGYQLENWDNPAYSIERVNNTAKKEAQPKRELAKDSPQSFFLTGILDVCDSVVFFVGSFRVGLRQRC